MLDHLFALLGGQTTLRSNDLAKHEVNLASHVGGVTTDVEGSFLLQKVADKLGVFAKSVLNVDLLRTLTRERGDDLQVVSKLVLVGLRVRDMLASDNKII